MFRSIAAASLLVGCSLGSAVAAPTDENPYKQGPVTDVGFIRVKYGHMLDYLRYLNGPYRLEQEALKKAGIILDYHIYAATPHNPSDPNVILTVTYPNYAALDRGDDIDAITAKVEGSLKTADKAASERNSYREVIGSELIQELVPRGQNMPMPPPPPPPNGPNK